MNEVRRFADVSAVFGGTGAPWALGFIHSGGCVQLRDSGEALLLSPVTMGRGALANGRPRTLAYPLSAQVLREEMGHLATATARLRMPPLRQALERVFAETFLEPPRMADTELPGAPAALLLNELLLLHPHAIQNAGGRLEAGWALRRVDPAQPTTQAAELPLLTQSVQTLAIAIEAALVLIRAELRLRLAHHK